MLLNIEVFYTEFTLNTSKNVNKKKQSRTIPATGRGGPNGCETSRLPYFLDNRLTNGGEVVSLMRLCPQEDSWYSFLLEADSTPDA
jgi:hypothetical protein